MLYEVITKEALFHSLYRHLYNRTDERFFQGYKPDLPFRDGMKRIWINYLRHRVEHYEESVFLEQYARSPYITPEDKRLSESMKTPFHAIIQRGKLEQLVKADVDDEMILLLLLGFIRELAHEHVGGAYEITQERIDKAFQLSWDAVKQ